MTVTLDERTAETVAVSFERSQQPCIKAVLPQKAKTVEEALDAYRKTLLPSSTSFGRIIRANGRHVGDIWCYGMDTDTEPNAMLSFCLFDTNCWNKGVATRAVELFLHEIQARFDIYTVGAFAFSDNRASRRVLEKNGFRLMEEFVEDGRRSTYYQYTC